MFAAKGGGKGIELWRSDGTTIGTKRVKDINPGGGGSGPDSLAAINGLLYFSASDGVSGHELWVSDGTAVGTHLVKNINPGAADSYPFGFTLLNGKVYFAARDAATGYELWRTDGTTAGTNRVKDIVQGPESSGPFQLTAFAGKLFFSTSIGSVNPTGTLYVSDGTAAGTKPFRDKDGNVITGGGDGAQAIAWLTVAGDRLFFIVNETELWRTNGTKATTKRIASMNAWELMAVGSRVFFRSGEELWKSDGTAATTNFVMLFLNSGVDWPAALNGQLFFFANREPWTSNGTPAGTTPVGVQVQPDSNYASLGGSIFFGGFADAEVGCICRDRAVRGSCADAQAVAQRRHCGRHLQRRRWERAHSQRHRSGQSHLLYLRRGRSRVRAMGLRALALEGSETAHCSLFCLPTRRCPARHEGCVGIT